MTLAAGSRLGPFEIVSPLGAGGMGEVYKARDPKLDRFVAVKVLPESLSKDADALARFEREAKAVAALNHPNILAIHDFGNDAGIAYAATELLEGESLRSRLDGGAALAPRRAVEIATAIAHGLAAAHDRGIVHRDLKPDNVFLTAEGRVKILDFGLAKRVGVDVAGTNAPTSPAGTEPGTVLGTVGYMSPEQVRGREVDHRTDIFSFGAILYEMLAGRRAFRGDSSVETMSAILKEDPPELVESGRSVSPALDRIVRHCLEKTPEARFQSARDVAFDLETLSSPASAVSGRSPAVTVPRWRRPALAAAIVAAAVVAGALLDRALRPPSPPPSFQRLTFRRGAVSNARFAADGRTVVYSAQWEGGPSEVFSISAAGQESKPLDLSDAMLLAASSGDELAVKLRPKLWAGRLRGTLARVPLAGGSPREIQNDIQEADWSPDGRALAVARLNASSQWEIQYPEGKSLLLEPHVVNALRLSRDGSHIAVAEGQYPWWNPSLALVDLAGSRKPLSGDRATGIAWSRTGREVWYTADQPGGATNFEAVDLSGRKRLVYRSAGTLFLEDISTAGDVLAGLLRRQASAMFHAPGASRDVDLAWHEESEIADLSPDGRTVLISEPRHGTSGGDFYVRRTDGSPAIRLGDGVATVFSPDAKWVLASSVESSRKLQMVPTGVGESRTIPLPYDFSQWWFLPDGRRIVVSGILPNGTTRIFTIGLDGKAYRQIAPDGVDTFIGEMPVSPDGRFVAAQSVVPDTVQLQLYPVEGGAPRAVPGFESDDVVIRWADDGHSLFVFKRNVLPARVFRLDVETGKRTAWVELMPADPVGVTRIPTIAMTPDGKTYAYNFTRELSDLYRIRGLK